MTNNTETTADDVFAPSVKMHHATRAKAAALAKMLEAEYPRLTLLAIEGDEIEGEKGLTALQCFRVVLGDSAENDAIYEGEKVPTLAALLDACADLGIDPTQDDEAEDYKFSGSVVPETYRQAYREKSTTGRCNGDWLAEKLAVDTLNSAGQLMMDLFISVLSNNGVALTGKWAMMRFSGAAGWQGRFRMNGRQVLEKNVIKTQVYIDALGVSHRPSDEWLATMQEKHGKWLAKEAKAEAAAEAAVREATGNADAA